MRRIAQFLSTRFASTSATEGQHALLRQSSAQRATLSNVYVRAASSSSHAESSAASSSSHAESSAAASSSSAAVAEYRYAPNVIVRQRAAVPSTSSLSSMTEDGSVAVAGGKKVQKRGRVSRQGVMEALNEDLRAQYDVDGTRTSLFSRRSKTNIPPGSIVNVETWHDASKTTFNAFAGVVLAIRRRNTSTSVVLRNLVNKTGVEVRYNIYSPLIKQIQVIQRATASKRQGGLRRARRAKLYYLRKDDKRLPNVARAIQVMRANEERQAQESRKESEAVAEKVVEKNG